jgi:MarR family transcriptional regulator, organic hydroperoxide resistance regulator
MEKNHVMAVKHPPIDQTIAFWLYRADTQWSVTLGRAFRAHGYDVTSEQWGIMARIRESEGVNQNRLSANTTKDRHNITRILSRLENRGFIERRPDEGDKRAYRIFLTDDGRSVYERLTSIVVDHGNQMINGLTRSELASLIRILEHIWNNGKLVKLPGKRQTAGNGIRSGKGKKKPAVELEHLRDLTNG